MGRLGSAQDHVEDKHLMYLQGAPQAVLCGSKVNAALKTDKSKSSIITPVSRTLNVKGKKSN